MQLGFSFRETLSGSFWWLEAPTDERAIALSFEARAADFRDFLRNKTWRVQGSIDAERLASGSVVEGTVRSLLIDERRLPYRFVFSGDDGRRYELSGEKEWRALAPFEALTLLPASLYDDQGRELARATLRFDARADLWNSLKSVRLRVARGV